MSLKVLESVSEDAGRIRGVPSTPWAESLRRHRPLFPGRDWAGWAGGGLGAVKTPRRRRLGFHLGRRGGPGHPISRRKGCPGGGNGSMKTRGWDPPFGPVAAALAASCRLFRLADQSSWKPGPDPGGGTLPPHMPRPPTACREHGASGRPQTERARRLERRARGLQAVRIPSHLRTGRPRTTEVCRLADVGVRGPRSRCWRGWLLPRAAREKPPVWPS